MFHKGKHNVRQVSGITETEEATNNMVALEPDLSYIQGYQEHLHYWTVNSGALAGKRDQ